MMFYKKRSSEIELLDIGNSVYTLEEYEDCLKKLDQIGFYLGGDRATFKSIERLIKSPESILEVGCGGGYFTQKLAHKFPRAKVIGIDINADAISYARKMASKIGQSNVTFQWRSAPELDEPSNCYDLIVSSLVCHHMSNAEIVKFIKEAWRICRKGVVINDLQRTPIAKWAFSCIAPLFFRNRLILHDGPISIRRSFRKTEWETYLEEAGLSKHSYRICWHWAFRWVVTIIKR